MLIIYRVIKTTNRHTHTHVHIHVAHNNIYDIYTHADASCVNVYHYACRFTYTTRVSTDLLTDAKEITRLQLYMRLCELHVFHIDATFLMYFLFLFHGQIASDRDVSRHSHERFLTNVDNQRVTVQFPRILIFPPPLSAFSAAQIKRVYNFLRRDYPYQPHFTDISRQTGERFFLLDSMFLNPVATSSMSWRSMFNTRRPEANDDVDNDHDDPPPALERVSITSFTFEGPYLQSSILEWCLEGTSSDVHTMNLNSNRYVHIYSRPRNNILAIEWKFHFQTRKRILICRF